tara:strand:+ start:156 stop:959 length:804 start_codon:yes stop_codon:yes gene_type:complete
MPAITLSTMRERVRRRLEDTSSLNPHWPDNELDDYINEAIRDLWDEIYTRNRYVLPVQTLSDYTWSADQVSADLTSLVGQKEFDVFLISQYLDSDNTFDSSNPTNYPVPLTRTNYEELYRHSIYSSRFYDDFQFSNSKDVDGNAIYQSGVYRSSTNRGLFRWAIHSNDAGNTINLLISPVPSNAIRLKIQIMKPFDVVEVNSDKILDNEFNRFVDLVEYGAVLKAKGRSDENTDPVAQTYFRRLNYLQQWLEARSRTGYARVVTDGY